MVLFGFEQKMLSHTCPNNVPCRISRKGEAMKMTLLSGRGILGICLLSLVLVAENAAAGQNFTISASPASLSIQQGNQGTSTITATISGAFSSAISLSAS